MHQTKTEIDDCRFCQLIEEIKSGTLNSFVAEMQTGYVIVSKFQLNRGYTLFISKKHVTELHELDHVERQLFLYEMSLVAKAAWNAFMPLKLNYEMMGNSIGHAHWHIIPRHADDLNLHGPYWCIDKAIREASATMPTIEELEVLKTLLQTHLILVESN